MSFTREYSVKAIRKPCRCDACRAMIEIGEPAIRYATTYEGEFTHAVWHPECRTAEIALNRLQDTMWYDEWTALDELDDEDRPWLIAEHPTVAARMGFTQQEPIA